MCEATGRDGAIALFKRWDADGSGKITQAELQSILESLDPLWTETRIRALFVAADINHDGNIDTEEFITWIFADDGDQQVFCESVGLYRGDKISTQTHAVLGIPDGGHHPAMIISKNRTVVEAGPAGDQGVFLSGALVPHENHALRIEIDTSHCKPGYETWLWIGICPVEHKNFSNLPLISFHDEAILDNVNGLPATKHYAGPDAKRVFAEGGITLCVDMDKGRLSMMDRFGIEAGHWMIEGLNDKEWVFAASLTQGQVLRLEVPKFVVTLYCEIVDNDMILTCTTMAGNELKRVHVPGVDVTTWREARRMLEDALCTGAFEMVFVLPDGAIATDEQNEKKLAELFEPLS